MKDKKYLPLGLLLADLIAVYFFLRTPVPWIFGQLPSFLPSPFGYLKSMEKLQK